MMIGPALSRIEPGGSNTEEMHIAWNCYVRRVQLEFGSWLTMTTYWDHHGGGGRGKFSGGGNIQLNIVKPWGYKWAGNQCKDDLILHSLCSWIEYFQDKLNTRQSRI